MCLPRRTRIDQAAAAAEELLARVTARPGDVPAILVGYRNDVLAWNPMGHALLFGHLPSDAPDRAGTRPNTFRLVFCDPHMRELYADWKKKAQHAVADLRLISGRYPGDPQLTSLIGELSVHSQEFARLWAVHPVRQCRATVRGFRHPLVGALTLNSEVMELVPDTGQRLFIYSAEPDSPSDAALRLLAGLTAENAAKAESAEDAAQHAPSGQHSVRAHPLPHGRLRRPNHVNYDVIPHSMR